MYFPSIEAVTAWIQARNRLRNPWPLVFVDVPLFGHDNPNRVLVRREDIFKKGAPRFTPINVAYDVYIDGFFIRLVEVDGPCTLYFSRSTGEFDGDDFDLQHLTMRR